MANKIQIKRSTANATVTGLSNGELAFTQASNTLWIGLPDGSGTAAIGGVRSPGTLTANQALVANSTSGIDKVIVANLVPQQVYANGSFGTSGYVLVTGGSGSNVYWESASAVGGVNASAQYTFANTITFNGNVIANSIYSTATVNAATLSVGGWVIANNSGVFTSGVVNGDIIRVGTNIVSNTTQFTLGSSIKFAANGAVGSANQVLRSDGSGVPYWSTDVGDISAVTAGNGISGGGTSGDVVISVNAGDGIASNSSGVHVVAGNSGVISNTSGVFVNAATFSIATSQLSGDVALGTNTSGNYVATITAGAGISGSSSSEGGTPTIAVVANDGIVSNSSGVFVKAGTGVTVNATGVHIGQAVGTTDNVTFANVVTTDLTVNGNTVIGSATSDKVTVNARVDSALVPTTNNAYDLGSNTLRWANVYINHISTTDGATFGSNVSIDGTLTISGNLVTQNVQSIIVSDPMIYLAGNNYSSDLVDIGFAANYNDGATNRHTGFFRDHTDGLYKLFYNLTQELSGNNDIDTGDASYQTATLVAYLSSGALSTNTTAVAITANSTVAVSIVANTLSLSTALPGTSGGTGLASYTAEDILVANSSNGFRKLGLGTSGYVLQSNGSALVYDVLDGGTF